MITKPKLIEIPLEVPELWVMNAEAVPLTTSILIMNLMTTFPFGHQASHLAPIWIADECGWITPGATCAVIGVAHPVRVIRKSILPGYVWIQRHQDAAPERVSGAVIIPLDSLLPDPSVVLS